MAGTEGSQPIEVTLESTATDDEVRAVERAFADVGIDAEVSASLGRKGAGDYHWIIYITVELTIFSAALMKAAGEAMGKELGQAAGKGIVAGTAASGRLLKRLIRQLYEARRPSEPPRGAIILRDESVHEEVLLTEELPEAACQLLLDLSVKQTESRQLEWDAATGEWRDAWQIPRPPGAE